MHGDKDEQAEAMAGLPDDSKFDLSLFSRFPNLEQQFRESYLEQNIARSTISTAIYLAMLAIITAVTLFATMDNVADTSMAWVIALRLGVACPALIIILAAIEIKPLRQHYYQIIVGTSAFALGVSVMAISAITAEAGIPQFQIGDVLVIVYTCMFIGLLMHVVVLVAILQVIAFFSMGIFVGVNSIELVFAGAVIIATALMVVLSANRVERLVRRNFLETRFLNEIAERDGLTGLYNRRKFDELATVVWNQARRDRQRLQILFIDIDNFKAYNDEFGHQQGDECIKRVARVIDRSARRPLDFCARYGGEEFVLVLYGTATTDLCKVAEKIRQAVQDESIPHPASTVAKVITVSVGSAAVKPNEHRSLSGLIQQADESLYAAKQAGRNLVVHEDVDEYGTTGAFEVPSMTA